MWPDEIAIAVDWAAAEGWNPPSPTPPDMGRCCRKLSDERRAGDNRIQAAPVAKAFIAAVQLSDNRAARGRARDREDSMTDIPANRRDMLRATAGFAGASLLEILGISPAFAAEMGKAADRSNR